MVAGEQGQVGAGGAEQRRRAGRARPPVAAVRVRRVLPVAPVAVRVRRSPAASPRISPTVMARTPRASSSPAAVAPERMAVSWVWWSLVSTVMPASAATWRARATWAPVSGARASTSQPAGRGCHPCRRRPSRVTSEVGGGGVGEVDRRIGWTLPASGAPRCGRTGWRSAARRSGAVRTSASGVDRGRVQAEAAEQLRGGDVEDTDVADGVLADPPAEHDRGSEDLAACGLRGRPGSRPPGGRRRRVGRGRRRTGRPRIRRRASSAGGPLRDERFGVADPEQQLPVGQVALVGGVLGGGWRRSRWRSRWPGRG